MDEMEEMIWQAFMPMAHLQATRIKEHGRRFVHYTNAESGMKILRSEKMLLRNSTMMNDFSEVQHGMNCLSFAFNSTIGGRLKKVMADVQEDLPQIFTDNFDTRFADVRSETYLISVSEHGDPVHGDGLEDAFGRLSMWRAYAPRNGIAFVFHNKPFVSEADALNAYTSPVIYATPETYLAYFEQVVTNIEQMAPLLKDRGGKFFHDILTNTFRFAVQSTKHPAFSEEREWRVIYSPTLLQRDDELTEKQIERIPTEIITLKGIPQRVYAIPFKNYEEEGFVGATVPELIDRVLIGPSVDAYPIAQAFVAELTRLKVEDAANKVFITGVPLRT